GTLKNGRPFRRQAPQVHARAFVAAVLAPHHAEDADFGKVRLALEDLDDLVVFAFRESVLAEDFVRDLRHRLLPTNAFTIDSKMSFPSALPRIASLDRSGCGIIPSTFRCSLTMPAMLLSDPLGLASPVIRPLPSAYRKTTWPLSSMRFSVSASAKKLPSP